MADPLGRLVADLRAAVPSYRGLRITVVDHDWPIVLTDFPDAAHDSVVSTSLRLRLDALVPWADPSSEIVLYAGTPGAFVDLAADVGHALSTGVVFEPSRDGAPDHDGHRVLVLDADLPPLSQVSGLIGLEEVSTINRAVGYLIDQGHLPEDAHETIRRGAVAGGESIVAFAARLLRR